MPITVIANPRLVKQYSDFLPAQKRLKKSVEQQAGFALIGGRVVSPDDTSTAPATPTPKKTASRRLPATPKASAKKRKIQQSLGEDEDGSDVVEEADEDGSGVVKEEDGNGPAS